MHLQRALVAVTPRIEITVEMLPGQPPVDHLDTGHLDNAMAESGLKTRGFRIQKNLSRRHQPIFPFCTLSTP